MEFHFIARGFDRYKRRLVFRPGELVVWDDIVLEPMTDRTTGWVVGRVRLEDEEDSHEVFAISVDQEVAGFTDGSGYFSIDPVRAGKLRVSAQKPGYVGMNADLEVASGRERACELVGYRKRFAHVRWAYQPDGTRYFDGDTATGTAVVSWSKPYCVSFAKGFEQSNHGRSDFAISQVKNQLVLSHPDASRSKKEASIRIRDNGFEDVFEAPESGYTQSEAILRPGDLYVFRCYDGKHYAMMEIVDITTESPPRKRR